ncbi:MAG: beta-ketoacyl synthase N-terminal-like domain-containing protein [Phycisphaeraceae bacterium]
MSRPVIITGLGPVSALGHGIDPNWDAFAAGRSSVAPIQAFDPAGFDSRIAGEVRDLKVRDFVPKSYRKATKVIARDIEIAVACADLAARDAGLTTKGTDPDAETTYAPDRVGAHIGAGLIAADLDELTAALVEATDEQGRFDIHKWGREGMTHLTPLWLLKYLPNMLACHVTIIHDAQGPSNTITCNEASGGLSVGESLRVIQRGMADACFCGGADSKLNPMAFLRQQYTGRLNGDDNDRPAEAVRPFSSDAMGGAAAEGGGILILEALESYEKRGVTGTPGTPYAQVAGFGASQTVHRESRNLKPDPNGRALASAIRRAMAEAGVGTDEVDLIVPFGCGDPAWDSAEASALDHVFGDDLTDIPVRSSKAVAGNCAAGSGALDLCLAARALREQTVPAAINCDQPLGSLNAGNAPAAKADLRHVLCYATGVGGQNAAIVLKRFA